MNQNPDQQHTPTRINDSAHAQRYSLPNWEDNSIDEFDGKQKLMRSTVPNDPLPFDGRNSMRSGGVPKTSPKLASWLLEDFDRISLYNNTVVSLFFILRKITMISSCNLRSLNPTKKSVQYSKAH